MEINSLTPTKPQEVEEDFEGEAAEAVEEEMVIFVDTTIDKTEREKDKKESQRRERERLENNSKTKGNNSKN